jgi:hypothetical protein
MTGTVSGLGLPDAVGGLVGQNSTSHTPSGLFAGKIQQSYSTAAITGGANSTIGGLVGLNGNLSTISQSYSAGSVTGGEMGDVGGLVGANSGGAIGQSYWDTQTSGQGTGVGYNFPPVATGTGLTTAQLQSGLPSGFDPTVWSSQPGVNNGFPCLLRVTPGCAPPAIATNQYASPCLNSSSRCLGGSSVNLSSDIDLTKTPTPNLLVGTGGGTGSLTVGPATLTAASVVLGVSSEGDGTIQAGGTLAIQSGALTVGGPSTGRLNDAGTIIVTGDTIVGDGAIGTLTQTGSANAPANTTTDNLIIGNQIGSNGTYTLSDTSSLTVNGNITLGGNSSTGTLIVGSGTTITTQGLTVNNGGTIQYNLTPSYNASITASGGVSIEAGGALVAAITAPLTDPTTGTFLTPGAYDLLNGSANAISLLPFYSPVQQPIIINGASYLADQFGAGTIYTPLLTQDQVQTNNQTISTFLVPEVNVSGSVLAQASLDLNQETLTYSSSTLPGTGLATPVNLNNENLLATLASDSGLNGLTITSAVRTDQQQAQLMINNLITMLSGGNTVPVPGIYADQVYQVILGGVLCPSYPCSSDTFYSTVNALIKWT